MPCLEGDTLRGRLRRQGRFSVAEAVPVLLDFARALAYAHRRGAPGLGRRGARGPVRLRSKAGSGNLGSAWQRPGCSHAAKEEASSRSVL
jgi:hypothetical protein